MASSLHANDAIYVRWLGLDIILGLLESYCAHIQQSSNYERDVGKTGVCLMERPRRDQFGPYRRKPTCTSSPRRTTRPCNNLSTVSRSTF